MPRLTSFDVPIPEIPPATGDMEIIKESAETDKWCARLLLILRIIVAVGAVIATIILALK